jgi:aspartate/methionine/tyrosine aminotransferase
VPLRPEVTGVTESPLVEIATRAERMAGAVKLCYGESDMPTPDFICRAADGAMRAGHTFYTHTAGCGELRQAIADKVFELHKVRYDASQIMASVGATAAIFVAIRASIGPGDNAVIISPTYAIFSNCVVLAGGEPRSVALARERSAFVLDLDRVRGAIDSSTRMLIVNSPSNPTGWVITTDEQRALYDLAERHDLAILSDEVYERLVFDAAVAPSFANLARDRGDDRVIVVNSFSKTYNMTGWRLGWAQASERVIRAMYKAAEFITSNPAAMVQRAGIVALRDGETYVAELKAQYAARRQQATAALNSVPGLTLLAPSGAFYAFFTIDGLTDSTAFTSRLLEETGLALAPGAAFGAPGEGYIRLCYAASEPTLMDALARFSTFMRRNRG